MLTVLLLSAEDGMQGKWDDDVISFLDSYPERKGSLYKWMVSFGLSGNLGEVPPLVLAVDV